MLKFILVTPKGELINEDFDFVSAKGDQGEVGILENRLPIILKISNGFVKAVKDKKTVFAAIANGILDNNNNIVTVLCDEACLGDSLEDANNNLFNQRENQKKNNKKMNFDFTEAEKDLVKAIKAAKASKPL